MWYFALSQNCFKCNYTNILASNPEPFYFVLQYVLKKLVFIRKSILILQWTNTVLWTNGVTSLMKVLPKDWIPSKLHEIIVVLFLTRGIRFQVKIARNHCANTKSFSVAFVHLFHPPVWGARVMKCTFDCCLPVGKAPKTRRHLYMCRCWQGSLFPCCQRPFYFHKDMLVSVLQYGAWITVYGGGLLSTWQNNVIPHS